MSDTNPKSESASAIQVLLSNAERVSNRVYTSAGMFLFLGLLLASVGVLYFYFSNDAVFLDKAFYQERITNLEAEKSNMIRQNALLFNAYNKRIDVDSAHVMQLNEIVRISNRMMNYYSNFYNDVVLNYSKLSRVDLTKSKAINDTLDVHMNHLKSVDKSLARYQRLVSNVNKKNDEANGVIEKYDFNSRNPVKPTKIESPYDKPELMFSPKLIYGFFSRLGGLIFIELIAFFLLRQYRINMNEFKYYDGIARQIRTNVYLVSVVENIEDDKAKVDIISKLFSATSATPANAKEDVDGVITSSEIEIAKKLLDSVKDLLKK